MDDTVYSFVTAVFNVEYIYFKCILVVLIFCISEGDNDSLKLSVLNQANQKRWWVINKMKWIDRVYMTYDNSDRRLAHFETIITVFHVIHDLFDV